MNENAKKKLKKLQADYSSHLAEKLNHINRQWEALTEYFNKPALNELHRAVHSLCGSSSSYGYVLLGQAARDLEVYLKQLLGYRVLNSTQQSEISRLLTRINDNLQTDKINFTETPNSHERTVTNNLILYLVQHPGTFERQLRENLKEVGYTLLMYKTLKKLQASIKEQIPTAVIIDEYFLDDKNITELEKLGQEYHINLICIVEHGDVETRLKSIHAGASIFLQKPIDIYYLTNRLVHLCSLSAKADYRILILEDSESLASYYALVLEEAGMSVRVTTKPMRLLQELQDFNPNLLLMDLYLPECSGFDLAMIVRQEEQYASLPIIFISVENDRYKQLAILNNCGGDDFLTKPVLPQSLVAAVKSRAQRSAKLSSYIVEDSLTKLLNHSYILTQLQLQLIRAERQPQTISVAMIDIDHFKEINDTYGHPVGDVTLKKIAGFLPGQIRHTDFIGRYGGEEFVIIFPNTSLQTAIKLCTRLLNKFASTPFEVNSHTFHITLSIGIADYPGYQTVDSLMAAADRALYKAKSNGRNRVEFLLGA